MGTISCTKEFTFDSCHHLENYVGACSRLHGHTYKLRVTVTGKPHHLDKTGMLIDFKVLNNIVQDKIISKLDHFNLNEVLSYNPTAENMAYNMFKVIDQHLKPIYQNKIKVTKVTLWETPTSYATYKEEY